VIRNLRRHGFGDALLFLAHLAGAHAVGSVLDTRGFACGAAMGTSQQAMFGELVDVATDSLRGYREGLGQFVDADVATFAGEVENVVLARREMHGLFLYG